ncbi:Ubiquitin carboxyl-terminal hydrolase 22 [Auxenochlorella protothecoides]|uniref:Ubiquitin carboxyl-terminal hydrolase 22 n=1 Tax=Auxenochlorella protothecoides TaxID=3075 RepID=A0A087SMS7_AUXPR|nr:Ubiquitin carboxyl-terminal hydrolase 22 [Auxenochlorella protothecoides]KFM27031.1 Ubiquitin carboxyl-terminal hydrolase 22 [Auxenochlorella protothecoides]
MHLAQDAHEFLVCFLDALVSMKDAGHPVAQAFSGALQSEVTCWACAHASTTRDGFMHLSLDIPPASHLIAPAIALDPADPPPAPRAANGRRVAPPVRGRGRGAKVGRRLGVLGLLGALKRLTRAEDLQGAAWQCAACGARGRGATKRLTLAALPPLLVLHAKRFEHPGGGVATKLNTYLEFPMRNLDMRPFLSSLGARLSRHGRSEREHAQGNGACAAAPMMNPEGTYPLYDLYAVVVHKGDFKGGHYVAYLRCGKGEWYLCDDACISAASEADVQHCQAYLLFYAAHTVGVGA